MRIKLLLSNLQNEKRPDSTIVEIEKSYSIIGRKNADLVLDEPRCSKQHAVFYQAFDGSLHIRDMGSTNGTFVNGVKIIDTGLQIGNEIRIGKCYLSLLEYESVQKTGVRSSFQQPTIEVPMKNATESKATAVDSRTSVPPVAPPKLPLRKVKAPANDGSGSLIHFVDEEGTENRMDFNQLIEDLEKNGPNIAPRKSRSSGR